MTSPLKTGVFKIREKRIELLILNRRNTDEKIEVYRSPDRLCDQAGRDRHPCGGSLQENGDQRGHILQLEEKIRWLGSRRIASVTPTGRGKCTAEEAGR